MVKDSPHITLTMGRDADGEKTTGDIGTLGLGFGIFQAWLYMAVFSVIRIFEPSSVTGFNYYLTESMANSIIYTFLASSAIALIFIGASNQRYLRFYVSKLAMWLGAGMCSLGTLTAFLACIPFSPEAASGFGPALADTAAQYPQMDPLLIENISMFEGTATPLSLAMSVLSGVFMGVGSSLLVALWGTGFARSAFNTIVLNAAISIPLGVIVAFLLTIWIPAPIAGITTACLPFVAILLLQILTPMPFYQRREKPIFDPFPAHRISYVVRIGIPTVVMGIVLGALRIICVGEVLPSGNITVQLVLGASCALSIVVFVSAIAMARRNPYWDTLFRNIVPIIVIGSVSIPFIVGEYAVLAAFLVSLGYICLEVLMWVFYADLSNRFSLSPIFVFGIGRGILEVAGVLGSALALWSFHGTMNGINGLIVLALICATLMSIGYSVLPRYREFKGIIDEEGDLDASTAHAAIAARSARAEQMPDPNHDRDALKTGAADPNIEGSMSHEMGDKSHKTGDMQDPARPYGAAFGTPETVVYNTIDFDGEPILAVDGVAEEDDTESPYDDPTSGFAQHASIPPGTDTVASQQGDALDPDNTPEKGSFYRRCDEISDQYMLSRREREVLPLLAKGHNAAFIQDKLCVSKSTAKTHINHIYKKLDIHTQQELLNMVEDRQRGPLGADGSEQGDAFDARHGIMGDEKISGSNYMRDDKAYERAVNEAASHPAASRPKPKRGYRASIFKD